ncbi:MAG: hypothetical protein M1605_03540 [Candidatus Thermoplasmatota archaeon]|nr:hypothetical protein [Candidatus Thermoplasmatota archaeon]
MPARFNLIDTFPDFLQIWNENITGDPDRQIQLWERFYRDRYEEIFNKTIESYSSDGEQWKDFAMKRIFPIDAEKIILMEEAHKNLLKVIFDLCGNPDTVRLFPSDLTFVIYVGIGTGAGWASSYKSKPAILFGLENIIDMHWESEIALKGLALHEAGHLFQETVRKESGFPFGKGPIWYLYEEGFAEYFESQLLTPEIWHQSLGQPGWNRWCEEHIQYLSSLFLEDVESGSETTRFFGSWYDIDGWKETGYFLGYMVMKQLELPLYDLACLTPEQVEIKVKQTLSEFANAK